MRKLLIVIDMQKDFIDGALGSKEAEAIVPAVLAEIRKYTPEDVIFTRDTHEKDYLNTQEGNMLPVPHCIRGTDGWQIRPELADAAPEALVFDKPTFGSTALAGHIRNLSDSEEIEVEICGLCTDICVVSNALLIKAACPEIRISLNPALCAGVKTEKHKAAIETMASCQIIIKQD